jgi:hypothetical protein
MYCKAEPLALCVCAEVTKLRYDTSRNLLSLISLCPFLFLAVVEGLVRFDALRGRVFREEEEGGRSVDAAGFGAQGMTPRSVGSME